MANLPLAVPRLVLLGLTWCLSVISGSTGLNAVIKRNQAVAAVKHQVAAQGIHLSVDTFDLEHPGIILSVGCTVLSVISSIWFIGILKDMRHKSQTSSRQPLSTRALPIEWMSLAFMSIWLLACNIPVTKAAAQGAAKTTAFLNGVQLPQSLVDLTQKQLGVNPSYWAQGYVRLEIIPPWFAFLLAAVTSVVSFIASRRRNTITSANHSIGESEAKMAEVSPIDKPTHVEHETV